METTVLGNGRGDQNIWFAGTMRSVRNSRGRKERYSTMAFNPKS